MGATLEGEPRYTVVLLKLALDDLSVSGGSQDQDAELGPSGFGGLWARALSVSVSSDIRRR